MSLINSSSLSSLLRNGAIVPPDVCGFFGRLGKIAHLIHRFLHLRTLVPASNQSYKLTPIPRLFRIQKKIALFVVLAILGISYTRSRTNTYTPKKFRDLLRKNHRFPSRVVVEGWLLLDDMDITSLPPGLKVNGKLVLHNCYELTRLPLNLEVTDTLVIKNCNKLEELPSSLRVGYLRIENCPRLRALPQSLRTASDVTIENCPSITELPRDLQFGGALKLYQCRGITSIPESIFSMGALEDGTPRVIELINLGLSPEALNEIRTRNPSGMQIHFSHEATHVEQDFNFNTLEESLQFWSSVAGKPATSFHLDLQPHETTDLCQYLARLTNTADYKNEMSRPFLADRILQVISSMSPDDSIKEKSLFLIHQGLISCDDRIISALSDVEQMISIHELEKKDLTEEQLREEGKRYLLLEMVREKAKEHKDTLTWVDEIEIYLAFELGLAKRFNLPVKTQNMIFRTCAQITDQQIQSIGNAIEQECTQEKLEQFLAAWSPWIKSEKRRIAKPYDQLPEDTSYKVDPKAICPLTQEAPEQPIVYKMNLYDYDDFRTWFIGGGTDPLTRDPIDWSLVRRVNKPAIDRSED